MKPSLSPWIHQLDGARQSFKLESDIQADVAIVGAGIAGIATAFFALKHTTQKIVMVEAGKIAHGATGHNAGQIVSYFEHPFARLVELYGERLAARAQEEIYYAWDLLDEMYNDAKLTLPLARFTGYAGCSSVSQIIEHLQNISAQRRAGLDIEGVLVAALPFILNQIPAQFRDLYARVDHKELLNLLETDDQRYIGVLASRKGCVNSALFCQELARYLSIRYAGRFQIFEHSPVKEVVLEQDAGLLLVENHTVTARRIVLCTNGFSHFSIKNTLGEDIDARFHRSVIGKVGYMAAYFEAVPKPPVAISYFTPSQSSQVKAYDRVRPLDEQDPYFYLTRRTFEHRSRGTANLVCIGGPESDLVPGKQYVPSEHDYPDTAQEQISEFMRKTFRSFPPGNPEYAFAWHGLMGYTPTGIRCIGPDPANPVLLYNVGCNGVGILSSIYGGKRISNFLRHTRLEPSLFDPRRSYL